ncbi:hypothetical protein EV421DRAFT_1716195, partial [Armillaria borealis]
PSSTSVILRSTRTSVATHMLFQPATDPAKSTKLLLICDKYLWLVVMYPQHPGEISNLDLLYVVYRIRSTRVTHGVRKGMVDMRG